MDIYLEDLGLATQTSLKKILSCANKRLMSLPLKILATNVPLGFNT